MADLISYAIVKKFKCVMATNLIRCSEKYRIFILIFGSNISASKAESSIEKKNSYFRKTPII